MAPKAPSVDEQLGRVSARGLLVRNLFQHGAEGTIWQCNLWDGEVCWVFGRAASAAGAVEAALEKTLGKAAAGGAAVVLTMDEMGL